MYVEKKQEDRDVATSGPDSTVSFYDSELFFIKLRMSGRSLGPNKKYIQLKRKWTSFLYLFVSSVACSQSLLETFEYIFLFLMKIPTPITTKATPQMAAMMT